MEANTGRSNILNEGAEQVAEELERLTPFLTELTRLPSRWNGQVELGQEEWFRGKKLFSCGIVIQAKLVTQETRWRTLIHESLHSRSAGYNSADYNALIGWEEGVVEQTQRLLRPEVLARAGVQVEEAVFRQVEADHVYNRYIDALEDLRRSLSVTEGQQTRFYVDLLATPIRDRAAFVYGLSSSLAGTDRRRFLSIFYTASDRLRTKGRP
jgi:hypothetical protein